MVMRQYILNLTSGIYRLATDNLRTFYKHISISFLAIAFIGSNIMITNSQNSSRLSELFLPDPSTISKIVTDISPYTNTINEDPSLVASTLVNDQGSTSYIDQVAILAMSQDNQFAGFAIKYTVQKGDTWSSIAKKNNLHTASVFAANGIDEARLKKGLPQIKEGDVLTIPAEDIDGPSNWIAILNDINNAKKQTVSGANSKNKIAATNKKTRPIILAAGVIGRDYSGHGGYPGGYCTSYVASQRNVGNWGNAGHWIAGARADGFATGLTPRAGSIMVTGESGWGHVALVQSVNGDTITVTEENYKGFGIISSRTVNVNSIPVKGFIY